MTLGEPQILYSGAIGKGSQILYDRTPKQRVEAVAPWLTIDGDPYPAVVGGKVQWIVDGYTTSNGYPYASRTTLGDSTADSLTDSQRSVVARQNQVNYIRNAVKATVDAYDGTVTLYQWDTQDPVLKTWMKAFPHTVQPKSATSRRADGASALPAGPVQGAAAAAHAATTSPRPREFYSGSEAWQVPDDPRAKAGKAVPPYYLSLKMPGQSSQDVLAHLHLHPQPARDSLGAFMAVDADATSRRLRHDAAAATAHRARRSTGRSGAEQVQLRRRRRPADLPAARARTPTVEYGNLLTCRWTAACCTWSRSTCAAPDTNYPLLKKVLVGSHGKHRLRGDAGPGAGRASSALGGGTPAARRPRHRPRRRPASAGARRRQQARRRRTRRCSRRLRRPRQAHDDGQAAAEKGDWDAVRRRAGGSAERSSRPAAQKPVNGDEEELNGRHPASWYGCGTTTRGGAAR